MNAHIHRDATSPATESPTAPATGSPFGGYFDSLNRSLARIANAIADNSMGRVSESMERLKESLDEMAVAMWGRSFSEEEEGGNEDGDE